MINEINSTMYSTLIDEGYYDLISEPKVITKMRVRSGIYENIVILLNEEKEDFKIVYMKEIRASTQYKELSIEETKNMLEKEHPILKMVEKLESFKKLNNELSDENKNYKSLKI